MSVKTAFRHISIAFFILWAGNGLAQNTFQDLNNLFDNSRKSLGNNLCVLISKNDRIVYAYAAGSYDRDTPELIASCSKWLTAAMVMSFVDEGILSVDDPVSKYLPEFNTPDKKNILLRHCLSHTTGIQSKEISLSSLMERRKYHSLEEEVSDFAHTPMAGIPGTVFAYSNVGLNTAGRILEVISGKDFETLFQERIARPLGMTKTTFTSRRGVVYPSGGATSTASDYLRFLEMILNQGQYHGKQILSNQSVALMQESQTFRCQVLHTPEQGKGFEYGFGEWVLKKSAAGKSVVIASPGMFGNYPYVNLEGNYAAIVFVRNLKVKGRKETYETIMSAIEKAMGQPN